MITKEKILEEIKDINYAYNDCSKYDTIKNLLEEMEHENTYHFYTQQDTYITEQIRKEGGTIDLFLGDIYEDMEDRLLVFRKADIDEFKDLMKDTIIEYINTCDLRNGGKY